MMLSICRLENTIQPYAWGSRTAIAELLGDPSPSEEPQAELWMGAHPKAPSMAVCEGGLRSLISLFESDPVGMLGKKTAHKFDGQLPYLFKVLAADKPLSIQAHPNKILATEGFFRENRVGIPMDAPRRNYKDPNHKPECLCALTRFWALKGFRDYREIISNVRLFCSESLRGMRQSLDGNDPGDGLASIFGYLMTLNRDRKRAVVAETVSNIGRHEKCADEQQWIMRLHNAYPEDIGVLSPLFMNLMVLEEGQGIFLAPGEPHAYLGGVGIELMANSDNVLRGGLTPKHVDLPELMKALDFAGMPAELVKRRQSRPAEYVYITPAEEFELSVIDLNADAAYQSPPERSVEILLCTQGHGTITDTGAGSRLPFKRGDSFIVPAAVTRYTLQGAGLVYKAAVPIR